MTGKKQVGDRLAVVGVDWEAAVALNFLALQLWYSSSIVLTPNHEVLFVATS